MKRKRVSILLICIGLLLMMTACINNKDLKGGIEDNSDPSASNKIKSKEISELSVSFYVIDSFEPTLSGPYYLKVKKDGNSCLIEETEHYNIK